MQTVPLYEKKDFDGIKKKLKLILLNYFLDLFECLFTMFVI